MDVYIIVLLIIILSEVAFLIVTNNRGAIMSGESRPIFVDTSVLMDGRIVDIAKTGFIMGRLKIPRSVVCELQYLADNADHEKRARARLGLDAIAELQNNPRVRLDIFQDGSRADEGVDERLIKLAKQYRGAICTIDYNLNKVATVEAIDIINVNDLAMVMRMAFLPGEKTTIELTQKGQDARQAVGHLIDGTMVVVENAVKFIGKKVEVEFTRSLQTAAGKMMFAKIVDNETKFDNKKYLTKKSTNFSNNNQRINNNRKPKIVKRNSSKRTSEQDLVDLINQ